MFRLALSLSLFLSYSSGYAEELPFLVREDAGRLVVQIARRDTCPMSQEQIRDAVIAEVKRSGIEPVTSELSPRILVLRVGMGCSPSGGASLTVRFLDNAKGTMIHHSEEHVDATSSVDLLDAVRMATAQAMIDYLDSNPELSRP